MKKFLIPLRRPNKKKDIEICFDLHKGNYHNFNTSANYFFNINEKLKNCLDDDPEFQLNARDQQWLTWYNTFLGVLDLLAECCIGRNKMAREAVTKHYENKILINAFENK